MPVARIKKRKTMAIRKTAATPENDLQTSVKKLNISIDGLNAQLNGIRLAMNKILKRLPE